MRITQDQIDGIADYVMKKDRPRLLVEDIQDMVEQQIMALGKYDLAKAYIIYRYIRSLAGGRTHGRRHSRPAAQREQEMAEENSNKDTAVASTQRDYIAGIVSRDLTRRILLPEKISKAHDEGVLHFHDADYFVQPIFNCCLINIGDMLDNGTMMNGKLIETPKSFQVACTVTTQIISCVALQPVRRPERGYEPSGQVSAPKQGEVRPQDSGGRRRPDGPGPAGAAGERAHQHRAEKTACRPSSTRSTP